MKKKAATTSTPAPGDTVKYLRDGGVVLPAIVKRVVVGTTLELDVAAGVGIVVAPYRPLDKALREKRWNTWHS